MLAGVGLDFQNCHNVIFFELDYEVDSFWQGQDRVHRPGQTEEVNIFVLIARNTPAVNLFRGIKTNINFVVELLKGKEDGKPMFERYTKKIDNHAFRGEYARKRYQELIKEKGSDAKDYRGYDSDVLRKLTKDLGHNRLDVVVYHYLR